MFTEKCCYVLILQSANMCQYFKVASNFCWRKNWIYPIHFTKVLIRGTFNIRGKGLIYVMYLYEVMYSVCLDVWHNNHSLVVTLPSMVLRPWATPFLGENGVALSNLSIDFLAVEAAPRLGGIGSESPLDTMTGWWFGTFFISPYTYIYIYTYICI